VSVLGYEGKGLRPSARGAKAARALSNATRLTVRRRRSSCDSSLNVVGSSKASFLMTTERTHAPHPGDELSVSRSLAPS